MIEFTPVELEAFARMVTTLLRVDGTASEQEKRAVDELVERVGSAAIRYSLDNAQPLADRDDLVSLSRTVTRKEAQQEIYEALYDVAASDAVVKKEWDLLKVLVDNWNIEP